MTHAYVAGERTNTGLALGSTCNHSCTLAASALASEAIESRRDDPPPEPVDAVDANDARRPELPPFKLFRRRRGLRAPVVLVFTRTAANWRFVTVPTRLPDAARLSSSAWCSRLSCNGVAPHNTTHGPQRQRNVRSSSSTPANAAHGTARVHIPCCRQQPNRQAGRGPQKTLRQHQRLPQLHRWRQHASAWR